MIFTETPTAAGPGTQPTARFDRDRPGAGRAHDPQTETRARYVVFTDAVPAAGWTLIDAVSPTGSSAAVFDEIDPSLDWFAEYRGPGTNPRTRPFLTVSGHTVPLVEARRSPATELPPGATDGEIGGLPAVWGAAVDGGEQHAVIALALAAGYTLLLSAHGVSLDELRGFAAGLEPATEARWVAAGGAVVD